MRLPWRTATIPPMALRVYSTLTKQKDLFEPLEPGKVRMYLCGPTVYKSPHIGHMVGPVIFDAIKRYLRFKGFAVRWVINITDVDDKLIAKAAEFNTTMPALAEKYTKEYFECLAAFGIDTVDQFPRASDHMPEIIEMCATLIEKGSAYAAGGGVWFDVTRDTDYGKLSHRSIEEQEAGTRDLEGSGKRNHADFALWKAAKPGEPSWESPWGPGRPGWHIECSAMSRKHLGVTLDIHGGGMDLLFPHHENELAQSESASGQPFVRFWLHNGLTRVNTKKISGSDAATAEGAALLATLAVRHLLEQHGPDLLRYLLLSTHYRRPIEFSEEVIVSCKKALAVFSRLKERIDRLPGASALTANIAGGTALPGGDFSSPGRSPVPPQANIDNLGSIKLTDSQAELVKTVQSRRNKFIEMMDDDFNTAGAIAVLHELAGDINGFVERQQLERTPESQSIAVAAATAQTLRELGQLLGLFRSEAATAGKKADDLPDQLMQLIIRLRQEARAGKNFALADSIRKGLTEIGITLEDRAGKTDWRR
jgi:cysteinyl-tRNA synthetase